MSGILVQSDSTGSTVAASDVTHTGSELLTVRCERRPPQLWNSWLEKWRYDGFHLRTEWADVFSASLHHQPWFLWVERSGVIQGVLPLMYISGPLFGKFLVSQPYLNSGGILADSPEAERLLLQRAVALADALDVKHLELRHERFIKNDLLNATSTEKVHMRLVLPGTVDELWNGLKSKLRSQIRKPLNDTELQVHFGHLDRLDEFYAIFCRNMRDLGTPPFSRSLFKCMLKEFGQNAEICSVTYQGRPVASGFLLHGPGVTLIPSASALREYNHTSSNMLMYWHVLKRSVERGQTAFDFGRSTRESGTWKFKQQWGAEEIPAIWQYYSRRGTVSDARPSGGKYDRIIRIWQKLPVWLTQLIGPSIVRGIP